MVVVGVVVVWELVPEMAKGHRLPGGPSENVFVLSG